VLEFDCGRCLKAKAPTDLDEVGSTVGQPETTAPHDWRGRGLVGAQAGRTTDRGEGDSRLPAVVLAKVEQSIPRILVLGEARVDLPGRSMCVSV